MLTIGRPKLEGGVELAYSGRELLLLAVGAGYCENLVREAAQRAIAIQSAPVDSSAKSVPVALVFTTISMPKATRSAREPHRYWAIMQTASIYSVLHFTRLKHGCSFWSPRKTTRFR